MRYLFTLLLCSHCFFVIGQRPARVTLRGMDGATAQVALVVEKVNFHPSLGVGLSDVEMITKGVVNLKDEKERVVELEEMTTPRLAKLTVVPPPAEGNSVTYVLFLSSSEDLTVTVDKRGQVGFKGANAASQQFLKEYFKANQYQYLPAFGFKPSQIKNDDVIRQSDSLQQLRTKQYYAFIEGKKVSPEFDAYVRATTATEPYLIRMMLEEREMRRNRVTGLTPEQQAKIDAFTLQNFKLFPDAALLSNSYREQLRNYILIPVIRKFPPDPANHFALSSEAILAVYNASKDKVSAYPEQEKYLLTYWMNYSFSAVTDIKAAEVLLKDYKQKYQGELAIYFERLFNSRIRLLKGEVVPTVAHLLDIDGRKFQLPQTGKPACIVFNFNIKQHEPSLKPLEDKYKDKVNFIYVTITPALTFDNWKNYQQSRPGVLNLWATKEAITSLTDHFAIDIRYPYLVLDKGGKLVKRWIPLDFPANAALEKEIQNSLAN